MKVRNGFVSNSSSSSFVCNICGEIEAGYECNLSDFEMEECEHGHTFHTEHADADFLDATKEEKFEYLKKQYKQDIEGYEKEKQYYEDMLNGKQKIDYWVQQYIDKDSDYLQHKIDGFINSIVNTEHDIEDLTADYDTLDDEEFDDKYGDLIAEYICDNGIPEEYCPVCAKIKEYEQDADWETYQQLKEKFDGIFLY